MTRGGAVRVLVKEAQVGGLIRATTTCSQITLQLSASKRRKKIPRLALIEAAALSLYICGRSKRR